MQRNYCENLRQTRFGRLNDHCYLTFQPCLSFANRSSAQKPSESRSEPINENEGGNECFLWAQSFMDFLGCLFSSISARTCGSRCSGILDCSRQRKNSFTMTCSPHRSVSSEKKKTRLPRPFPLESLSSRIMFNCSGSMGSGSDPVGGAG